MHRCTTEIHYEGGLFGKNEIDMFSNEIKDRITYTILH